jgi:hypothetical protein
MWKRESGPSIRPRARSRQALLGVLLMLGALALLPVCVTRYSSPASTARGEAAPIRLSHSPSEAALSQAKDLWVQGACMASRSVEQLEEWDPAGLAGDEDRTRLEILAQSPDVRHAWAKALQAQALARNAREAYRATCLLVVLNCAMGRHQEELSEARRLVAIAPHDSAALLWLRHAARCNSPQAWATPSSGTAVRREPTERRSTGRPVPLGIRILLPP